MTTAARPVFCIVGPGQVFAVRSLLHLRPALVAQKPLVLIFAGTCTPDFLPGCELVDFRRRTGGSRLAAALNYLRVIARFRDYMRKHLPPDAHYDAYIAHVGHFACNHLLFAGSRSGRRFLIPDGMGNLLQAKTADRRLLKLGRRKALLAKLMGLANRYRIGDDLWGTSTGRYDGSFAFLPDVGGPWPEPVTTLAPSVMAASSASDRSGSKVVLVLDQPLENRFGAVLTRKLRQDLAAFVQTEQPDAEVLVKYHPSSAPGRRGDGYPASWKALEDRRPAEFLLDELAPAMLIGFISTSLLHARLIAPQLRCVSIGARELAAADQTWDRTASIQALERLGAEIR